MENNSEYANYNSHLGRSQVRSRRLQKVYDNYYRKNLGAILPAKKGAVIVDIGCGTGEFLNYLRQDGYTAISGIDLVPENIEVCRGFGLTAEQVDIFEFIAKSDSIADVFILNNVLEHFNYFDITRIIDGLLLKLRVGGKLLIIVPNCNNVYGLATFYSDITHKSPLTEKSFDDLLQKTQATNYSFHNLIVYLGLPAIDSLIKLYNKSIFAARKINNLLNGQKPFKVQSKNLLLVITK